MTITLSPQTEALLNEHAARVGADPNALAEKMVSGCLEWERRDYEDAVAGIRRGFEDSDAGRMKSAQEVHQRLREKLAKHEAEQSIPA